MLHRRSSWFVRANRCHGARGGRRTRDQANAGPRIGLKPCDARIHSDCYAQNLRQGTHRWHNGFDASNHSNHDIRNNRHSLPRRSETQVHVIRGAKTGGAIRTPHPACKRVKCQPQRRNRDRASNNVEFTCTGSSSSSGRRQLQQLCPHNHLIQRRLHLMPLLPSVRRRAPSRHPCRDWSHRAGTLYGLFVRFLVL